MGSMEVPYLWMTLPCCHTCLGPRFRSWHAFLPLYNAADLTTPALIILEILVASPSSLIKAKQV